MSENEKKTYAAGSWQDTLDKSAVLFDRSAKGRAKASKMLWDGGQAAISQWLENEADRDVHAEVMYADVLDVLGTPRKGDASKIKSVALAVKNHGLVMGAYPNLSKAYAEASRLTKTVKAQTEEDNAADVAIEVIAANVPKSTSTPEGAAQIVLSQGTDEAARLLLDALGAENTAAHRSLLRAISEEVAGRVGRVEQEKKDAAKREAAEKRAAAQAERDAKAAAAKAEREAKAAERKAEAAKKAAAKPKPAAKKATGPKPKPAAKATAPKPEPVEESVEDLFPDDLTDEGTEAEVEEAPVAARPKPVRRGPVSR